MFGASFCPHFFSYTSQVLTFAQTWHMATFSMTGYGRAEKIIGSRKYTVEIRSLNSKQTDLTVKLPTLLREVEMKLRTIIAAELGRGDELHRVQLHAASSIRLCTFEPGIRM